MSGRRRRLSIGAFGLSFLSACGGGPPAAPSAPQPAPTASPSPVAGGTTIGAAGGTVTSTDGRASLVVPPAALATPTSLAVGPVTGALDAAMVQGSSYDVSPASVAFAVPAVLAIRYDPAQAPPGVPERDLTVAQLGAPSQKIPTTIDEGAHEARAPITSGATYAVRWAGPAGPCASAYHAAFDFWLGTWNARQTGGGFVGGPSVITKDGGGCLVHENWAGGRGRSISYVGADGAWYQNYVTVGAPRIPMRGAPDGSRMVLMTSNGSRFTWEPRGADVVRYLTERSNDGGATWTTVSDWEYFR